MGELHACLGVVRVDVLGEHPCPSVPPCRPAGIHTWLCACVYVCAHALHTQQASGPLSSGACASITLYTKGKSAGSPTVGLRTLAAGGLLRRRRGLAHPHLSPTLVPPLLTQAQWLPVASHCRAS